MIVYISEHNFNNAWIKFCAISHDELANTTHVREFIDIVNYRLREYNASIPDANLYTRLEFKDEKSYHWFLLRWS